MKKIDRVKPRRRYGVARYPSHADPDPTLHPYPVPFPFHRELVRAVAGVGLAATLFGCEPSRPQATIAPPAQQPPDEKKSPAPAPQTRDPAFPNPQNPFVSKNSGLPHRTSPYGTGQPSYLGDEAARKLIDRIFKEEGFDLAPHVLYDQDGVAFRASGYDRKRGIGYVWAWWPTLDEDAIISWSHPATGLHEVPSAPQTIRDWFKARDWRLQRLPPSLQGDAARIQAMPDGPEMAKAFARFSKAYHAELLSMEEIKALDQAPGRKEFVAVISQFDGRHASRGWGDPNSDRLRQLVEEAKRTTDAKRAEAIHREILELEARDVLTVLERNVREYIAWARSQGLQ